MIGGILVVKTTVAFWAPIRFVHEPGDGGTPLVMMFTLQQNNGVRGVRTTENEEKWMLARQHFKLIRRIQGGEILLKRCQFRESTRTLGNTRYLMKLSGSCFLSGIAISKSLPENSISGSSVVVGVFFFAPKISGSLIGPNGSHGRNAAL